MHILKTYGDAAAMASVPKRTRLPKVLKESYIALCSSCDHYYFTKSCIETKLTKYLRQGGMCFPCRKKANAESKDELRAAKIALALRRQKMKLKW